VIGLLGGSFDPIHHGHLIVAQAAVEALGLEELRFVPARMQPLKGGRHGAPAGDRAAMIAAAIAGEPRFRMDPIELGREGPSYTVDTLRTLREREPDQRFALLIGSDAARDLGSWREPGEIAALAEVVAFGRAGEGAGSLSHVARWITVPAIEVSSTAIRERVRTGRSIRYWVPDSVASYIAAHGLYQDGAG
jgi:nicotinate-nucleotide adenylyltransferase